MEENAPWIDVSVPLVNGMISYPGDPPVEISRLPANHDEDPMISRLSASVHLGTHIDAPLHYIPEGKGIDLMPAAAMIGPARVIGIADPHVISVNDLQAHSLSPGERILFKTRNSSLWESPVFREDYVYLSTEGASFLAEKGVLALGIDYLSIGGFNTNEPEVHRILLEAGVWIIEGLNLRGVEPGQYDLVCMPLRIIGVEAAPARVMIRPLRKPAGERS
ncbi:MAG TPA: arylformamidase [Deltaproteobacteria bacterium]|nr:arylformamidase [Deltaproteobacteria bacterium]